MIIHYTNQSRGQMEIYELESTECFNENIK